MRDCVIHRVGIGTDVHRLASGRRLRLGGVEVPFERGLLGHSDADVVLHALTDAVLGAAGLPDIGEFFPDTDPRYRDADSGALLVEALRCVAAQGYEVVCADVVIQAERPRLTPHKEAIRENVARLLGIEKSRVGVKAKTNEGLDAIGRGEAIGCTAVAGLSRAAPT